MPSVISGASVAPPPSELPIRVQTCPACGFHVSVPVYDGGRHPLATLGWPASASEAESMERLPLDFVSCVDCGHVFNASFDYRAVPYSRQPNLMFNQGRGWSAFLASVRSEIIRRLPARPAVVEIGYGDGRFLAALAAERPGGRFIGFDPHGLRPEEPGGLDLRAALFEPSLHLAELRPDLLISRHVLEHLADPLGFVQSLSFAAACERLQPLLYLEVPCIDRALEHGRLADFYYEHNSHFTTSSFSRMLERSFTVIDSIGHGYGGEVVYAFLRLKGSLDHLANARSAARFRSRAAAAGKTIREQLDAVFRSGKPVAVWGGTGKSAAFMQANGIDARRFPLVVDSDAAKAGTFVPETGQEIRPRDVLIGSPPHVIIVPTQWRAADIVAEMEDCGIPFRTVLIEHGGRLVDFFAGEHPYGKRAGEPAESILALAQSCDRRR